MMSRIVFFLAIFGLTSAATFIGYLPEKPKEISHKEGCYIREVNDVIPFGTTITPIGQCVRIHCGEKVIDYATCGVVGAGSPNCYVTKGDLTKAYPDCCPNVECESDNDVV